MLPTDSVGAVICLFNQFARCSGILRGKCGVDFAIWHCNFQPHILRWRRRRPYPHGAHHPGDGDVLAVHISGTQLPERDRLRMRKRSATESAHSERLHHRRVPARVDHSFHLYEIARGEVLRMIPINPDSGCPILDRQAKIEGTGNDPLQQCSVPALGLFRTECQNGSGGSIEGCGGIRRRSIGQRQRQANRSQHDARIHNRRKRSCMEVGNMVSKPGCRRPCQSLFFHMFSRCRSRIAKECRPS